jgi:anti-anti-sigma regulatory factor
MERPIVVVDCSALPEPDAEQVDGLARLQLSLRRRRCELRLVNVSQRLLELIEFAGLAEVLRVEPGGKAEEWEDAVGVEEERDLGDPSA